MPRGDSPFGPVPPVGRPIGSDTKATALTPAPQRLTVHDWIWARIPDPDFLMGEVFSTTSRGLLAAPTGIGKTMFCMALGLAKSEGRDFLQWRARRDGPAKVLYIDGEMSQRLMKRRLIDTLRRAGSDPESADLPEHFHVFCLDELSMRPPPLTTMIG
jgi:AAA domain